jgi:dihydroneopterin aldolase
MGTIRLLNLALFGHHGVSKAERETGTRLDVDVELKVDLLGAAGTDHLEDTVDYVAIHRVVEEVVKADRHMLLESLADGIATRLLERFEPASAVLVRIRKGNLPLAGGSVEVELERKRS